MLIPSIDLMQGKVVQLVQGSRKALEFDSVQEWIDSFAKYPLVQVIDLDARITASANGLDRSRALLAKATTPGDVASMEADVARRETELETLKGQQAALAQQVALSGERGDAPGDIGMFAQIFGNFRLTLGFENAIHIGVEIIFRDRPRAHFPLRRGTTLVEPLSIVP